MQFFSASGLKNTKRLPQAGTAKSVCRNKSGKPRWRRGNQGCVSSCPETMPQHGIAVNIVHQLLVCFIGALLQSRPDSRIHRPSLTKSAGQCQREQALNRAFQRFCIPRLYPEKKGTTDFTLQSLDFLVGMARFERAASASRTLRSSQAEPHPVEKGNICETRNFGKPFFICKKIRAGVA